MTELDRTILSAESVCFGFERRPRFIQDVSLRVSPGQVWGILGPNGAGKSTLLRLLAGLASPVSGRVLLDGRPVFDWPPRRRAARIAFLPQSPPREIALTVRQIVLMGRYPHRQLGLFETVKDIQIAERAMVATQTLEFADRPLSTLSGGEAQRVHIAAALAQEPGILLLDEPTSALDLCHQLRICELATALASVGMAIVLVTHDLNLAVRYCSRVLLLDNGCPIAAGAPREVITPEVLEPVYLVKLAMLASEHGGWIAPISAIDHVDAATDADSRTSRNQGIGTPSGGPHP